MLMLSLDPGGTTGAALLEFDSDTVNLIRTWQVPNGLMGFHDWYWDELADGYIFDVIVCESFNLREGLHGVDLTPTYVIGALEGYYYPQKIIYQEPKLKPLCDDSRLKLMGLHEKGKPHANDAVRHGIIYLRNRKHKPTLMKGWVNED